MSESEFSFVLSLGIPIFIVFAVGALAMLFIQANQLAKLGQIGVGKSAAIGGLSFVVSVVVTVVLAFFVGLYVAGILLVLWFITAASMPNLGSDLGSFVGLFVAAIPVGIILVIIGIVLGVWPLALLSIRGYKIAKQKKSLGSKIGAATIVLLGAAFTVTSLLAVSIIMTSIAIELSGKRFGLT